jgi:hypothetical protein
MLFEFMEDEPTTGIIILNIQERSLITTVLLNSILDDITSDNPIEPDEPLSALYDNLILPDPQNGLLKCILSASHLDALADVISKASGIDEHEAAMDVPGFVAQIQQSSNALKTNRPINPVPGILEINQIVEATPIPDSPESLGY